MSDEVAENRTSWDSRYSLNGEIEEVVTEVVAPMSDVDWATSVGLSERKNWSNRHQML